MPSKLKMWLGNSALLLGSLAITLLVLETVVFGMILKPDDVLNNVSIDGVVRYQPETGAVFRHPGAVETHVTINANGWNSTKPKYNASKIAGRLRVAVIGDSYVHGTFVDAEDGFPELIETNLKAAGIDAEVYRFGMDGAPLTQYLHMLRREVLKFKPDLVVVQLIHNDFDESYRLLQTRYASSFLKMRIEPDWTAYEILPADFRPGFADWLRNFATFRYLYYETNLHLKLHGLTSRMFWGETSEYQPEFISSAVDIRTITDHEKNLFVTRHVMAQMNALALEHKFKLAFAMDGVREAIYDGKDLHGYAVSQLNAVAAQVTSEQRLPFADLQQAFTDDYKQYRQRFEFPYDWHWNKRGNEVAAEAITRLLLSDPALLGNPAQAAQKPPGARRGT